MYGSFDNPGDIAPDLASISSPPDGDLLSDWVRKTLAPWIVQLLRVKPDPRFNAVVQYNGVVRNVTRLGVCLLASSLQLAFLVVLKNVVHPDKRLGVLAVFGLGTSVLLAITTNSTHSELFAINAA